MSCGRDFPFWASFFPFATFVSVRTLAMFLEMSNPVQNIYAETDAKKVTAKAIPAPCYLRTLHRVAPNTETQYQAIRRRHDWEEAA